MVSCSLSKPLTSLSTFSGNFLGLRCLQATNLSFLSILSCNLSAHLIAVHYPPGVGTAFLPWIQSVASILWVSTHRKVVVSMDVLPLTIHSGTFPWFTHSCRCSCNLGCSPGSFLNQYPRLRSGLAAFQFAILLTPILISSTVMLISSCTFIVLNFCSTSSSQEARSLWLTSSNHIFLQKVVASFGSGCSAPSLFLPSRVSLKSFCFPSSVLPRLGQWQYTTTTPRIEFAAIQIVNCMWVTNVVWNSINC